MQRSLLILVLLAMYCTRINATEPVQPIQPSNADKPNILFLLSDDHSYPFLSTYGNTNVKTPVLDQLAAEGMKFHRFFTSAPQCVPSRAAFMTGRSPVAARMTRFSAPLPSRRDHIARVTARTGRLFHRHLRPQLSSRRFFKIRGCRCRAVSSEETEDPSSIASIR